MAGLFVSDYAQIILPLPIYLLITMIFLSIYAYKYTESAQIKRIRIIFPILTLWTYLATTPAIGNILVTQLESGYTETVVPENYPRSDENKIIVLSSGFTRHSRNRTITHLDRSAWERIFTAVKLWKSIGGNIYIAGGAISNEAIPFSRSIKDAAITMGVPEKNIFIEQKSINTYRNFYYLSKEFVFTDSRTWLVTSAYHMDRALGVAKTFSMKPIPVACDFNANDKFTWKAWLPNLGATSIFTIAMHELIGITSYRLKGYLE